MWKNLPRFRCIIDAALLMSIRKVVADTYWRGQTVGDQMFEFESPGWAARREHGGWPDRNVKIQGMSGGTTVCHVVLRGFKKLCRIS